MVWLGVLLGIINILIGLYILWQFHRYQQLFCRCQHPPKITAHYPMAFGFIISGGLCIAVCLFTRGQNEMLDVAVWLLGLLVLMFLPQQKKPAAQQKQASNGAKPNE